MASDETQSSPDPLGAARDAAEAAGERLGNARAGASERIGAARDAAGNTGEAASPVSVLDRLPPAFAVADISVVSSTPNGVSVNLPATATDAVAGEVPVTCTPASGSVFPIGVTPVTGIAHHRRAIPSGKTTGKAGGAMLSKERTRHVASRDQRFSNK